MPDLQLVTPDYVPASLSEGAEGVPNGEPALGAEQLTPEMPTFIKAVLGTGAIALSILALKSGIDNGNNHATMNVLKASGSHALEDFKDGKFRGLDVATVTIQHGTQQAHGVATVIAKPGEVENVRSIITPQTGDVVEDEEQLVVDKDLVKPEYIDPGSAQDIPYGAPIQ
jgi:hypothetical protein